jgi:glyoxylase-like metal-dependent hydrolase (beta-lactamase superfamily II)
VQRTTNIYLLDDDGGVVVYETGSAGAAGAIRRAAAERGGITRIVLSHAHADHRGGASRLDAPIFCHPDERPGAEGDGWAKDGFDFSKLRNPLVRAVTPLVLRAMDGGPLDVAGTLAEGDSVAGFQILHLPGHTPGQVGLWRESDRLAIVSDAVFVWDPFSIAGLPGRVRLPPPAVRPDDTAARASMRRIAALDPATVWLGHYGPVTGDVPAQLEHAADGA